MRFESIGKNKYFKRPFSLYFLVIFASVLITFALFLLFAGLKKNNYYKNMDDAFAESCTNITNTIQTECYDFCFLHLYEYIRPSFFSNFYNQTITGTDDDNDFLKNIRKNIIDTLRHEKMFSDIILYRNSDDMVVSAKKSGFLLDSYYSEYDDIRNILKLDDFTKPFFMPISSGTGDDETTSLYYIFPKLKNGIRSQIMTGFAACVVNDPSYLFKNSMSTFNSAGTFIALNETGILYSDKESNYTGDFLAKVIDSGKADTPTTDSFSKDYYFLHSTVDESAFYPITYLYYEPHMSIWNFMSPGTDALSVMLYILLLIIYSFALTIFIALSKYRSTPGTTYSLKPISSPITDQKLIDVLETNTTTEKYFAGILIEINSTLVDLVPIITSYLDTFNLHHYINTFSDSYILCVLNYSEEHNNLRVISQGLSQSLINSLPSGILFNVYYSSVSDNINALVSDIEFIISCKHYTYILGFFNTISQQRLVDSETNPSVLEPRIGFITRQYFIERKMNDFKTYLTDTKNIAISNKFSFKSIIQFYESVIYAIKNYFIETKIDHPLINTSDIRGFSMFDNLNELISYISDIADFYDNYMQNESSFSNRRIIENIITYIENNIESVTLAVTAEHFNITPPHLSRTFKEATGTNFSDFVSEKKLLKAAWLLENESTMTVAEISHRMGYNTPAYFSQKFKIRFGTTPAAYRKRSN